MNVDELLGPLVLSADAALVEVAALPEALRARLPAGDHALIRSGGRGPSQVLDAASAELIRQFTTPARLVDAVIALSGRGRGDAEAMLGSAYPLISALLRGRFLRPATGAAPADALVPGMTVAGGELGPRLQQSEDTEVFQVRDAAGQLRVLKIARAEHAAAVADTFAREAAVLEILGGASAPRLFASAQHDGRPYLVMAWREGITVDRAAAQLGAPTSLAGRAARVELACQVVRAYAALHAQGVLHGDVHPGNVLVERAGTVSLIDFGYGRILAQSRPTPRAGMPLYWEPELARAQLEGAPAPEATPRGEQYAVGALLYEILTGAPYLDFVLEPQALARQITTAEPLTFAARGVPGGGAVEAAIGRALSKDPAARFDSVAELGRALTEAVVPAPRPGPSRPSSDGAALVAARLAELTAPGAPRDRVPPPPTCAVMHGAAGTAYALHRIAVVREDPAIAASAVEWAAISRRPTSRACGFLSEARGLTDTSVGRVSPYFAEPGVQVTSALVAASMGDAVALDEARAAFLAAVASDTSALDLTLGRSGVLWACAVLSSLGEHGGLEAVGDRTLDRLWAGLQGHLPGAATKPLDGLGLAHGWSGALYATLRWCQARRRPLPDHARDSLEALASRAVPRGRGAVLWDGTGDGPPSDAMAASWCRGSAGQVTLWSLAHRMFGDDRWRELAERLAWATWDERPGSASLCCGDVGRAYAMLEAGRVTGDPAWWTRAQALAQRATEQATELDDAPDSLFRGRAGLAMLWVDLERPGEARMPFTGDGG